MMELDTRNPTHKTLGQSALDFQACPAAIYAQSVSQRATWFSYERVLHTRRHPAYELEKSEETTCYVAIECRRYLLFEKLSVIYV
ncbi:hypothetical protein ES702_00232 [subsurface metagenome]